MLFVRFGENLRSDVVRKLQARRQSKSGGLAAARRAWWRDEGVARDREADIIDAKLVVSVLGSVVDTEKWLCRI